MFLVNSRLGSFAVASPASEVGSPYPEVTDAFLPSSLTLFDSFALVYSTSPPVLVYGTVSYNSGCDGFLGSRKSQTTQAKPSI